MKKLSNKKVILLSILLLFVIYTIWYYYPVARVLNVSACTLDGSVADVSIDIRYYRSFFKPTYAQGTIIFNGNTYINPRIYQDNKNFIEKVRLKYSGFNYIYFVNSSLPAPDYISDTIQLYDDYFHLYKFSFILNKQGVGTQNALIYYAPASTVEEANEIYNFLYPR
jgi:hypothetical protein